VVAESSQARRRVCASLSTPTTANGPAASEAIDVDPAEDRWASPAATLEAAALIVVPCVAPPKPHAYAVDSAIHARCLRIGGTMRALLLAIHAQGLASRWVSPEAFDAATLGKAVTIDEELQPLGAIAIGRPAPGPSRAGIAPDVGGAVRFA
jgi:nitroreductase